MGVAACKGSSICGLRRMEVPLYGGCNVCKGCNFLGFQHLGIAVCRSCGMCELQSMRAAAFDGCIAWGLQSVGTAVSGRCGLWGMQHVGVKNCYFFINKKPMKFILILLV